MFNFHPKVYLGVQVFHIYCFNLRSSIICRIFSSNIYLYFAISINFLSVCQEFFGALSDAVSILSAILLAIKSSVSSGIL